MAELTLTQETAVQVEGHAFWLGAAGSGKTTALRHRIYHLLQSGDSAYSLLVLVAELAHRGGHFDFLYDHNAGPHAELQITTYQRMAQEMVALFWPLVARPAGFASPGRPPTFLSYDLAQLLMWRTIDEIQEEGAFADLRLRPQQIVSQLLDTLNRAALNALSLEQAIARQQKTWRGEAERLRHLEEAAGAARAFRRFCLEQNLLDLSLVIQVFDTQLVQHPEFRRYFSERYRHLLVDNVEEQTPAGQNFIRQLMGETETAVLAYDSGGGYKRFMAADPTGAAQLAGLCAQTLSFDTSFTAPPPLFHLANLVKQQLQPPAGPAEAAPEAVLAVVEGRYRREMVSRLAAWLANRLDETGIPPAEVAIIAPYLDGALRYMLGQALQAVGLPYYLLRRRSSPRDEPRVRAWLTWLALAHPQWDLAPSPYDVAEALTLSIAGLDPARAQLLVDALYHPPALAESGTLPPKAAARLDDIFLERVDELRIWLDEAGEDWPLDQFLHRLFHNLLAQPRFQPEPDLSGAAVCAWLVETAGRLQAAAPALGLDSPAAIGRTFIAGINQGLVTADPPELGDPPDTDGVMISTIYGYLLSGRPVDIQVWLETAATGWWDIPSQPLSNAFVLAQSRDPERPWTTEEDFAIRNQLLSRIIRGLAARCRRGVVLANSDLDRRGQRQEGILWRALAPVREEL